MVNTDAIFSIQSKSDFNACALEVFRFQFENNPVYRSFCDLINVHHSDVTSTENIPFLPIQFFKSHRVLSENQEPQITFTSSGTTGQVTSKHHITDVSVYEESFTKGFQQFYGNIQDYTVLALLPSYLEREGSSLIYMAGHFIKQSQDKRSGFYLNNLDALKTILETLNNEGKKTLLMGVSFALLDLVERYQFHLKNTVIMETGGMKGRRKELIREELHAILKSGFDVDRIHSEYGMTELLSQAYSQGNGLFKCPPWMKLFTRDPEDALTLLLQNKTGGINIMDLANVNSCSFIATQDLGKVYPNGSFEVLGRFDNSDIRGCNLMVSLP